MREIFFTSDTHFGHPNIIRYCKRPWIKEGDLVNGNWISKDIAIARAREMDEELIANWNAVVKPQDLVYHLGDFAFRNVSEYLDRLNGFILFVGGNHDQKLRLVIPEDRLPNIRETIIDGQHITMCHYAMRVWNKSHFNAWHLYGHSHGTLASLGKSMDVGVDPNKFRPISFQEVKEAMRNKPNNPNWVMNLPGFDLGEYNNECKKESGEPVYGANM